MKRGGFTLIEIILVMAILACLTGMVVPRLAGRGTAARYEAAKTDIQVNISTALKLYEFDTGVFPTTEEGLHALTKRPVGCESWRGPYANTEPRDPWGKAYGYRSPGEYRLNDFDLFSAGADGQPGNDDDVVNWEE